MLQNKHVKHSLGQFWGKTMETKSTRTQGWKAAIIFVAWLAVLAIALTSSAATWVKIVLLLAIAAAVWEMGPGLETPNYEPDEWDVEMD